MESKTRRHSRKSPGRPATGTAQTAAERMRRLRARRRDLGLKPVVEWRVADPGTASPYSPHRLLDARSLAMHAVIAEKINRKPVLLETARRNLARWQAQRPGPSPKWLTEWQRILGRPLPEILAVLTDPASSATALRQSSPFAGILTEQERRRIYDAFRA
jgi:hypothetical protein